MTVDLKQATKFTKARHQNNQRNPKPVKAKRQEPNAQQLAQGHFTSAGMAYKRTPVIDTLFTKGKINALQHTALSYYRDQASAADRSPIKSNIDFAVRSGNQSPIGYQTPQQIETLRIERDLGKLRDIVRAVAVDDVSLPQWCIKTFGGRVKGKSIVPKRETLKNSKGEVTRIGDVDKALLDLRYGAGMIVI